MRYTDLVFDLYGTLVDIHTDENDAIWEKTAVYFGFYGAHYTGPQLRQAFYRSMEQRQVSAGQSYECFPDIPFELVMEELFREAGRTEDCCALGIQAAQLFRIASMEYIRLYPYVPEALQRLRERGYRLWLLSNAQQVFTAYELRHLSLGAQFDGIYLSSDYGCRKPDRRFFNALLRDHALLPSRCLMIGNDLQTDIAGARATGMDTLYMHTNLTPGEQRAARPVWGEDGRYEFEGSDWEALTARLCSL